MHGWGRAAAAVSCDAIRRRQWLQVVMLRADSGIAWHTVVLRCARSLHADVPRGTGAWGTCFSNILWSEPCGGRQLRRSAPVVGDHLQTGAWDARRQSKGGKWRAVCMHAVSAHPGLGIRASTPGVCPSRGRSAPDGQLVAAIRLRQISAVPASVLAAAELPAGRRLQRLPAHEPRSEAMLSHFHVPVTIKLPVVDSLGLLGTCKGDQCKCECASVAEPQTLMHQAPLQLQRCCPGAIVCSAAQAAAECAGGIHWPVIAGGMKPSVCGITMGTSRHSPALLRLPWHSLHYRGQGAVRIAWLVFTSPA